MSLVEAFLSPNLKSEDTAYGLPGRAQIGLDCEDGGSLVKGGCWGPRRVLAWAATLVTVEREGCVNGEGLLTADDSPGDAIDCESFKILTSLFITN